ncbi:MAG: hypothetical protein WD397_17070 [Wenzhouxiangellaceae bacterium]
MNEYVEALEKWESTLCKEVDMASLFSRNPEAHKWKLLHRIYMLRELVAWRFVDLLKQATFLACEEMYIGSRILLRASIETLALLIYSSQKMDSVVKTGQGFHELSDATSKLLLGSRNEMTKHQSINILTIVKKADKKYAGIFKMYGDLSETTHPNWQGMSATYSIVDSENYKTELRNNSKDLFVGEQKPIMNYIMAIFESEYNRAWPASYNAFESWVGLNSNNLEPE